MDASPSSASRSTTALSAVREQQVVMDKLVSEYITQDNWDLLSERGRVSLSNLIHGDAEIQAQKHVYSNWPDRGIDDEGKQKLSEQVSLTKYNETGVVTRSILS